MNHASYHNHTHFSDGADAPEAFVAFAKAANITSLGFSDHYYKASPEATATPDWALPCDALNHYFDSIHDLKIRTEGIEILAGLEFDWLEHSADWLKPIARDPRLDYTIGSVHFVGNDAIDLSPVYWQRLTEDEINHVIRAYWTAVRDMAASGLFDIAGHLDLVKKFNFYSTEPMDDIISEALDAITDTDMVIELNTAGWRKTCKVCYPAEALLQECFRRERPVLISSDAHQASLVAADFDRARDLLQRIGYKKLTRFHRRERFFVPII